MATKKIKSGNKEIVTKKTSSKSNTSTKQAPSNLDVITKTIRKKYGNVLSSMTESKPILTTSTGLLGLDIALGRGGIAKGRVLELYGPYSSGKTTLAIHIIKQVQDKGGLAAFVDAEHAADPKLFKAMGVDTDKLILVNAYSGEANLEVAEQLLKSGEIELLVVDSVSALIPQMEADSDISNDFMALLARLMSKALRKFVPLAGQTGATVIFINQIRHTIGSWGNPEITTGGNALNFYASYRIRTSGGATKSSLIVDKSTGEIKGHTAKFEIIKNKLAPPFRQAELQLIYGKGYDVVAEVLKFAIDLGIINKAGSWFSYEGESIAQGVDNLVDFFENHKKEYELLKSTVIEAVGLKDIYLLQERLTNE